MNEIPKNVSESVRRRNPHLYGDSGSGIRPAASQPTARLPLEGGGESEDTNWYASARRFEIQLTVYSVRPADWDGYYFKALQDFLVKAGVIPQDRWDIVIGATVRSKKAATEGEEKTVINIMAYE